MNKLLLTLCMLIASAPAFAQDRNADPGDRRAREERARQERAREDPRDRIDWEAEYKAYLKENPSVAKAVETGKISKEKVMVGIKSRAAEAKETKLRALFERMKREDPEWRNATFEGTRGDLEWFLRQEEDQRAREEGARQERTREEPRDRTNWEAEYTAYLKENPSVAKAVESGKISKEKVMAGIKARAAEAKEAKLKALYERMKREDPGWARVTFEQARPRLEYMLREEESAKGDPWEAKFQVFLRQNPALRESFTHGLKKENVIRMLKHGDAELDESDKAAQQARSEKALSAALKIMTDTKKLKPEQAKQLHEIVFPPVVNWEAKYQQYLKDNPAIASAVKSGEITKENVLAGIKAREGEKPLTEEEKIEALYQKLLREDRTLGRTPKEQLMPQLEKMLARGEAENLRPEQSLRSRQMEFGQTFSNLIESGQVERFDKDLQLVFDFGITEIVRQAGPQREGQRGGGDERVRAERVREREDAARGNDRAADSSGKKVPGTLKWSIPLGGGVGYHSPAIAEDGTVYMAADGQRLVALNPDGTVKWTFVAGSGYPIAGAAIGMDGTIYIGTWSEDGSDSRIYAITADGTEKWSYSVGDKIEFSSPAIGKDGTIYVGCYDDHLYAMNPDGTKKWSFRAEFNLFSSPAVGQDGTIYIASENGKLYAVNPENGTQKWSFQTGNYIHGSPSIATDGTVYIGSSDKNLYALNAKDGSEKWRFTAKDQVHAPPAIGEDGTLYVGSNDGSFYALNPDGTKKWSFRTGKRVDNCSAAIGKDGTIYFGSDDNHIYALNPDGSEKWRFRMNGVDDMDSSPAIGEDGTIYVGSMDGNLYAIHGESGGLAETPWPMFGGDPRHTGRARSGGYSPPVMKLIPRGQYDMGNHNPSRDKLNKFASPVHNVSIDAFWMDVYELTNQKYCEYLNSAYGLGLIKVSDCVVHKAGDSEPYCDTYKSSPNSRIHWDGKVFTVTQGKKEHPMVEVSWYGAVAFANWKSAKAGLTPCYDLETWQCNFDAEGFRLPTEAEWEKAARGGEHNPYFDWPWGNSIDGSNANYYTSGDPFDYDMPATTPVGYYDGGQTPPGADMANGYGLYDMAGNVAEWCNDWYDKRYYSVSPKDNPRGPESGTTRVCRSGSWGYTWSTAMRIGIFLPDYRGSNNGFRLVRKN